MVWYNHLDQKAPSFLMWHFTFLTGLINLSPAFVRINTTHKKSTGRKKIILL
jgi:hypothetical protein